MRKHAQSGRLPAALAARISFSQPLFESRLSAQAIPPGLEVELRQPDTCSSIAIRGDLAADVLKDAVEGESESHDEKARQQVRCENRRKRNGQFQRALR